MSPVDGRKERWSAHRAARRREFVDAALRSLAADGPELRVERVAAEAGVSKPVLYRQFTGKADLLAALHERATAMLVEFLAPALDPSVSPNEQIRRAVDGFFAVLDDHPNFYRLVSRTADPSASAHEGHGVQAGVALAAVTLTGLFDEHLHAFGLDTRGAKPMAHAIVGMVHSTADWWLDTDDMNRKEVVDHLTPLVWAVLDSYLRRCGVVLDPDVPISSDDILLATPSRPGTTDPAPPVPS